MPAPTDLSPEAIKHLRNVLLMMVDKPELLDKVLPGYSLVRKPMSVEERTATYLPVANAARQSLATRRALSVAGEIRQLMLADPAISTSRIAAKLNERGIPTPRRTAWTSRKVKRLMEMVSAAQPPAE